MPANRPPSGPGVTTPVSNEPSSAVSVWGLPPTLANTIVDPAGTDEVGRAEAEGGSPSMAGSRASTRRVGSGRVALHRDERRSSWTG